MNVWKMEKELLFMVKRNNALYRVLCSVFACLLLTVSVPLTAAASDADDGITPYYVRVTSTAAGLSISEAGKADVFLDVTASYPTDRVVGTVSLVRLTDNGWESVKDWYVDDNGCGTVDTIRYVTRGYIYQVVSSISVYTADGTYCETVTPSSKTVSYF